LKNIQFSNGVYGAGNTVGLRRANARDSPPRQA
jgi:hypothetical protein